RWLQDAFKLPAIESVVIRSPPRQASIPMVCTARVAASEILTRSAMTAPIGVERGHRGTRIPYFQQLSTQPASPAFKREAGRQHRFIMRGNELEIADREPCPA